MNLLNLVNITAVFNEEECEKIKEAAAEHYESGEVHDFEMGEVRQSDVCFLFPEPQYQWIFERLNKVLEVANPQFGFELSRFNEGVQVTRYEKGGHYDWHYDLGPGHLLERKLSITIQLTKPEEYEGGLLEFPLGGRGNRALGSATVFPSYMLHRVSPVTKGVRHSLVSWVAGPTFR